MIKLTKIYNMIEIVILILVNIRLLPSSNLGLFHWYGMLLTHADDIHTVELVMKLLKET